MYAYLYNVFMAINMFEIEMGLRRTIIIHKRRVHIFPYECGSHSAAIYYHIIRSALSSLHTNCVMA